MSTCAIFVSTRRFAGLLITVLLCLVMSGCHNHPVRHLGSDVGLIKAGETTRQEALSLLGDPDSTRMVSATTEEWMYQEEDKSLLQQAPVVGGVFSAKGVKTVVLTLNGDIVTAARYGDYSKGEFDWKNDCKWQKIDPKAETTTETKTGSK
ncbi:MAG: hypothetical protein NTY00_02520 [Deltaproteobacteria bacterium]|nr:hypothetical protein [Deltaproteobacteria bacterium]